MRLSRARAGGGQMGERALNCGVTRSMLRSTEPLALILRTLSLLASCGKSLGATHHRGFYRR